MRYALALLAAMLLAGCGSKEAAQASLKRITPPQDDRLARGIIEDLRTGDLKPIVEKLDRRVFGDEPEENLLRLREYIDPDQPKAVELIAATIRTMGERKLLTLSYQLEFPSSWCLAEVTIRAEGTSRRVVGLRAYRLAAPLERINAFTFQGKGIRHYLMIAAAVAIPAFMVVTLIVCIASRIRLKWLWVLFLVVGFGKLGFNWTSGEFLFQPFWLHVQLFGAGLSRSGWCGPWILSVSLPVGGIAFLLGRKALIAAKARRDAAAVPQPPVPPTEDSA